MVAPYFFRCTDYHHCFLKSWAEVNAVSFVQNTYWQDYLPLDQILRSVWSRGRSELLMISCLPFLAGPPPFMALCKRLPVWWWSVFQVGFIFSTIPSLRLDYILVQSSDPGCYSSIVQLHAGLMVLACQYQLPHPPCLCLILSYLGLVVLCVEGKVEPVSKYRKYFLPSIRGCSKMT